MPTSSCWTSIACRGLALMALALLPCAMHAQPPAADDPAGRELLRQHPAHHIVRSASRKWHHQANRLDGIACRSALRKHGAGDAGGPGCSNQQPALEEVLAWFHGVQRVS